MLGEQSIPYYYNAKNFTLNRFWSYEKTIRNKFSSILSYRARQYNGSEVAQNPLTFSHDKLGFLRIEGHLGKSKEEVEKQLELTLDTDTGPRREGDADKTSANIASAWEEFGWEANFGLEDIVRDEIAYQKSLQK